MPAQSPSLNASTSLALSLATQALKGPKLPKLHAAQQQIVREAKRYNVPVAGRRFGKTAMHVRLAAECAIEGFPVGWFAPTYKVLYDAWSDLKTAVEPLTRKTSEVNHRIELVNGGVIECWSLKNNPDAGRSRKYKRVIIDEAVMIPNLLRTWQMSIRATLIDYRGDAWFPSTPRGFDDYKTLFDRGQDERFANWASWQMPTSANPFIHPDEIAELSKELPDDVLDQEILALFKLYEGAVFRRVKEVCTLERQSGPEPGHMYGIGIDWGQVQDATVFSVWDYTTKKEVDFERMTQTRYDLQIERLETLANKWSPILLIPEINSVGRPNVERMQEKWGDRVVPFETTNASKVYVVRAMSTAMDRLEWEMIDDPVGNAEMQSFTSKKLPSGLYSYSAPTGGHDDVVMARLVAASPLIEEAPQARVEYEDTDDIGGAEDEYEGRERGGW